RGGRHRRVRSDDGSGAGQRRPHHAVARFARPVRLTERPASWATPFRTATTTDLDQLAARAAGNAVAPSNAFTSSMKRRNRYWASWGPGLASGWYWTLNTG